MNFLVDTHLPRRLVHWLRCVGHDAVHTRDLPQGNHTDDDAPVLQCDNRDTADDSPGGFFQYSGV